MLEKVTETGSVSEGLIDSDNSGAYPILGYSYLLFRSEQMTNCDSALELYRYIEWLMLEVYANEVAENQGMNQILPITAEASMTSVLSQMKCDTVSVPELVEDIKLEESKGKENWKLIVRIIIPICACFLLGLAGYIIYQHIKLRRALYSDDWLIQKSAVKIKWDKHMGNMTSSCRLSALQSFRGSFNTAVSTPSSSSTCHTSNVVLVGVWRDKQICFRKCPLQACRITRRKTKIHLLYLRNKIVHQNILRFIGVTYTDEGLHLVNEHATKGTMNDVLQNNKYNLDDNFKFSMALDVAKGLEYLHAHGLVHGYLTSACCFLDDRWNIHVADWELITLDEHMKENKKSSKILPKPSDNHSDPNQVARAKLWHAPELLYAESSLPAKKSDVYSFSILLVEIFTREDPYSEHSDLLDPMEVMNLIKAENLRPDVLNTVPDCISKLMVTSWDNDPQIRPSFKQIITKLKSGKPSKKSVIECMMDTLQGKS